MKIQVLVIVIAALVMAAVEAKQRKVVSELLQRKTKKSKVIPEKKASIDSIENILKIKLKKNIRFKNQSTLEHKKLASINSILTTKDDDHHEEKKKDDDEHHEEKKKDDDHHDEEKKKDDDHHEEEKKKEDEQHHEEPKKEEEHHQESIEHKEEENHQEQHHQEEPKIETIEHKEDDHHQEEPKVETIEHKEEEPKKDDEHHEEEPKKEDEHEHHDEDHKDNHKEESPIKALTEQSSPAHTEQSSPSSVSDIESKDHAASPQSYNNVYASTDSSHATTTNSTTTTTTTTTTYSTDSNYAECIRYSTDLNKTECTHDYNNTQYNHDGGASTPASTTPASTTPASTTPASTTPATTDGKVQKKKEGKSFLPYIHNINDEIDITKLKMDLMTSNKFNKEFNDWEDSDYVRKISEYGRQELKDKRFGKVKEYNVIKNSFNKDKNLNEEPMIYKQIQDGQFTEVLTPVQQTPTQAQLWSNFKTSHFFDVDYQGRGDEQMNLEAEYDSNGNRKIFERVIRSTPVKMKTEIKMDIDPTQGLLNDIKNPMKALYFDKTLNKDIKLDYQNNDYKSANKIQSWGMDKVMDDIDKEIATKKE